MKMKTEEAKAFIKAHGGGDFHPFAYYDKDLDCIRVRLKDCSMIETRFNRFFTIVEAAHSLNPEAVGLNIKGVRYLIEELGLQKEGVVQLTALIDAIVKEYPDQFAQEICKKFRPTIKKEKLTVSLDLAA